jgi:hypothetical protein
MKNILAVSALLLSLFAHAQTGTTEQLQQATALLKQFKEPEALAIYQQIAAQEPTNIPALVKCTELNCSIGERQTDKSAKATYFNTAKQYADKALSADSNSADALYAQALAFAKLASVEDENKKTVEDVKQMKLYADKALAANPNHAMANYIEGKWHYEMLALNWFKKAALKAFFGKGLATPDIDTAITYLEKCRALEPYFVQNYLDLAKAYGYKKRPAQQMEVLNKMVKLPTRTADDVALKEEGKKMLKELQ